MIEPPNLVQRAREFAAEAFAFYERFPFPTKGWYPADQFYRASSSSAANYCAAKRGRSTAEFISKLGVVVEEIDEAVRWLEHMKDVKLTVDPALLSEAEELRRILVRPWAPHGAMSKSASAAGKRSSGSVADQTRGRIKMRSDGSTESLDL